MEIDNSPIEEFRNQFKIKKAPVNYLAAEQRSVKSVILALVIASSRIAPESFCIKSRTHSGPTSGYDEKTIIIPALEAKFQGIISIKKSKVKISELLNFKLLLLHLACCL